MKPGEIMYGLPTFTFPYTVLKILKYWVGCFGPVVARPTADREVRIIHWPNVNFSGHKK